MKSPLLMLFFAALVMSVNTTHAQEDLARSKAVENDPDVFATVNGTPLGLNLYHFLLGSREQESLERQAQDEGFDAAMNRQQTAKDLVMTEVLAQQATRLGMHETELVKVEMAMAEKTLLAQLFVKQLMDSIEIDEAEIRKYYEQQQDQAMYRFMIWRTPEEAKARTVLKALKAGREVDLSDVIETPWLRDVDIAPEVNALVRGLAPNDFAERPVFQDGFWKLVQVIDKNVMAKQSYDEEREIIKAELARLKLDEKLESLAEQASIVFNEQHISQQVN
ncbi:hypothetical protein [Allohahella sp. A8]|uniref:peptidylprolyl isomerase n=1 Tax=Allohahella sp. A8 TaxID=3141461 RepID=UPI003A803F82